MVSACANDGKFDLVHGERQKQTNAPNDSVTFAEAIGNRIGWFGINIMPMQQMSSGQES